MSKLYSYNGRRRIAPEM